MKTTLQELIEWMEQNQYFIGNGLYAKQKELLEKERKQIENAYYDGVRDSWTVKDNKAERTSASKDYYNETFKQ